MLNISSVVFLTKFVSKKAVFASFVSSNSLCFKCKQKTPKEQTKKCIKFHTRMNLISLMRCHSLVARLASPTFICIHWCGFNYIFICISIRCESAQFNWYQLLSISLHYVFSLTLIGLVDAQWHRTGATHRILCRWWQLMRDRAQSTMQ